MRTDDYIWQLIGRSIYGEVTVQEEQVLQQYLNHHPELQQQYHLLLSMIGNQRHPSGAEPETAMLLKAKALLQKARAADVSAPVILKKNNRTVYYTAAAVIALVLGVAGVRFFTTPHKNKNVGLVLEVQKGVRKHMRLPDGSAVWLNGGSKLYYVTDFKGVTREVRLEGEAFFDVVTNAQRPFIVHVGAIDIKVLGTAFNVKAYEEEPQITTSLYRGLISVSKEEQAADAQPILVYPNQKLIIPDKKTAAHIMAPKGESDTEAAIKIEPLDSTQSETTRVETAWMYNRLEFRDEDFVTLAYKMDHWYNIKIRFADERVKALRFNGSFEKENIQQALTALKIANPFNYKIDNHEITIQSSD